MEHVDTLSLVLFMVSAIFLAFAFNLLEHATIAYFNKRWGAPPQWVDDDAPTQKFVRAKLTHSYPTDAVTVAARR